MDWQTRINEYKTRQNNTKPLNETDKIVLAKKAIKETENFMKKVDNRNHKLKINHYDRYGNYHFYD